MNRRNFLKTSAVVSTGMGLAALAGTRIVAGESLNGAPNAEKLGWRLGCQAYSFNQFTFFDAVDKTASLGLHCIEAYPGQRISKELPAAISADMTAADRKTVLAKLADSGVKMVGFGVGGYDRKHFEFAKEMGVENVVAEPNEADFDAIDKLCEEFQLNLAIHNHPKPSHYWNPDTVLKVCKGHSKRIGACADTGHWSRSGFVPLDCLKKLDGHIISFHFKDLNRKGPDAHDVPWGAGVCDVKAMLTEIRRQKLKAVFSAEYEYHWDNSVPDLAKCVAYFDRVAAELAGMETNMPSHTSEHLR
jgi:sugar phosphate isomerase/epimerase